MKRLKYFYHLIFLHLYKYYKNKYHYTGYITSVYMFAFLQTLIFQVFFFLALYYKRNLIADKYLGITGVSVLFIIFGIMHLIYKNENRVKIKLKKTNFKYNKVVIKLIFSSYFILGAISVILAEMIYLKNK